MSSPFDYLLIFWVTNYVHKKRFFKIVYGNKDSKLKKRLTKRTVRKVLIFSLFSESTDNLEKAFKLFLFFIFVFHQMFQS